MINWVQEKYKRYPLISIIIWVVALSWVVIGLLAVTAFDLIDNDAATIGTSNIIKFNAASVIALTLLLVCIAWSQLAGIKKVGEADFLFRIDERFGSEPIMKARAIIQKFYRESKSLNPGAKECVHRRYIAEKIDEISRDPHSYEDYTALLNLLDFLETISYYANENKMITVYDVKNLMGPSMEFFFAIFKIRIQRRRKKYRNAAYYCELIALVKTLRTKKYKSYK